jgi:hypothetical protein
MFKKLLANASFSPSVANTIGFYIGRLREEELTRRLGLIFSVLAVALQSLAIISPPEATIAAGPNNIIYSGVTSVQDLLNKYDQNNDGNGHNDLQQIFSHYGISRQDIANAKPTTIKSTDRDRKLRSIGRKAYDKAGEVSVPIPDTSTTVYERYLWSWDSGAYSTYSALQGTTSDGRWFAVLMSCGNLVVDQPPPAPMDPVGEVSSTCEAITGWAYDPNESSKAIRVRVYIRLDGGSQPVFDQTFLANLPTPEAPGTPGNHGFRVPIPADRRSSTQKTIYTVIALDGAGGGNDIDLARTVYIDTFCREPEPTPQPCPYDLSLNKDDPLCEPCAYQNGLLASDEDCVPPPEIPEPCEYNDALTKDDELCAPCPFDAGLWINDPGCDEPFPLLVYSKRARNVTQDIDDANNTTADPGDQIVYSLGVENLGDAPGEIELSEDLSDVLEYAQLTQSGGGSLDQATGVLSWGTVTVEPGQTIEKTIGITIDTNISAAPSPANNPESNNLELRNVWHTKSVTIKVPRPVAKTPEVLAASLPNTGPGANTLLSFVLIVMAVYFYSRNRQLTTELSVAKVELNQGRI